MYIWAIVVVYTDHNFVFVYLCVTLYEDNEVIVVVYTERAHVHVYSYVNLYTTYHAVGRRGLDTSVHNFSVYKMLYEFCGLHCM